MEDGPLRGMVLFLRDAKLAARINLMIFEWRRAYPNIDIQKQLGWAHAWLMSNPKNAKKDLIRFLNNWMKGEERRQGDRRTEERRAPATYKEEIPPEEEIFTAEDWAKMKESIRNQKKVGIETK